ncbi:MAG: lamin tail domain-containing protein [Chloroflexi bacterium]|nr:lamin tail domain-containing protein [Chloroflexota bacterium]
MRLSPSQLLYRLIPTLVLLFSLLFSLGVAQSAAADLFFSEYIEGSSNNKALEIFNGTGTTINLATGGYNVQMFFNGSATSPLTINLTGMVADGDVFVLAQASASAAILAQADQTNGAGWYNGDDAVVLRKGTTVLDVIGQIGFDPGTEWGSGLTSTADNTLRRKSTLCAGDPNGADAFNPAVEWDGFATDTFDGLGAHSADCGPAPTNPTATGAATPNAVESGETSLLTVSVTPGSNPTSTGLAVVADLSTIGGNPSQSFFDDGTNGDVTAGDNVFSYRATVTGAPGAKSLLVTVTDAQGRTASATINLNLIAVISISQIQGSAHLSPLRNQIVTTKGIVTAKSNNGFWIQSQTPDGDESTSEGLFIFTSSAPTMVTVGDSVRVTGRVTEFRPGGSSSANLTTTELDRLVSITVLSSGNPLPAPTVIGSGGRVPPGSVINDDGSGNVENQPPATFDAVTDGIDFYESLEGMRVQVNNAVVVGPTNGFNETWVLADNGANAGPRTARGGIFISPTDFNPERIQLEDTLYPGGANAWPDVSVGARLTSPAVGVVDYNFGNFEVLVTQTLTVDRSTEVTREVTALAGSADRLTIATFNVENLGGNAEAAAFASRANQIVNHLGSPDIVVLEEIQDNNGATNDIVTDAIVTFNTLISAIQAAGGPAYAFAQINPADDQDGGQPGGNIRVGFLYNPARVTFNARPGGDATTANSVFCNTGAPMLTFNPGRVDPNNGAFFESRKPLAGQFEFNGEQIFVIGVHFNSKGGDNPLFGFTQPPVLVTEAQRVQQAQVVNSFANSILTCAPDASVIVLGDVNDFTFSLPVQTLKGGILHNLFDLLPANEQYSYVFEGNSQVLDQMVVSRYLFNNAAPVYDVVHVNAEFTDQVSDHEPSVAMLRPVILVDIDIKPGSDTNPINLKSNGKVPVAILGSLDFDAAFVDPSTVTLAGAPVAKQGRRLMVSFEDVNGDRILDMLLHFETKQLKLTEADTQAILLGRTIDGTKLRGLDSVRIVGSDAPVLLSPASGTTVNTAVPVLDWDKVGGEQCYLIQVDDEPGFAVPLVQEATVVRETHYTTLALPNGTYYWRVQVGGTCNVTPGPWSETWRITVAP